MTATEVGEMTLAKCTVREYVENFAKPLMKRQEEERDLERRKRRIAELCGGADVEAVITKIDQVAEVVKKELLQFVGVPNDPLTLDQIKCALIRTLADLEPRINIDVEVIPEGRGQVALVPRNKDTEALLARLLEARK
jgi:hypothetical protein